VVLDCIKNKNKKGEKNNEKKTTIATKKNKYNPEDKKIS
jgi:hypothetical protein